MRIALFVCLFFVTFIPSLALAKDCAKASSSADVMRCLSRQYDRAQDDLNKAFDQLSAQNSGETLVKIKDVQGQWIQYRDLECAHESENMESQSLERLEKLRCLNRLTEERVNAIRTSLQNEERASLGETGAPPRWMNALASDYPNIFWRYGARTVGDLDCDGMEEYVIEGARADVKTNAVTPILAISENPSVGRPVSSILVRNITRDVDGEEETVPCDFVNEIQFHEEPEEDLEDSTAVSDSDFAVCKNAVSVQSDICGTQRLHWNGKAYAFETPIETTP